MSPEPESTPSYPLQMLDLLNLSMRQGLLRNAGDATEQTRRLQLNQGLEHLVMRLSQMLAPEIVLEVGAHAAEFSRQMKVALPLARVVAFEANPPVHARHRGACERAGVEYLSSCVGDVAGTAKFRVPRAAEGHLRLCMGSILEGDNNADSVEYDVPMVTLDGFLGAAVSKSNVMWVDVEGACGNILAGAQDAMRSCQLFYVELETRQVWRGQSTDAQIIPALAQLGLYPVFRDMQRAAQYNALFLHESVFGRSAIVSLLQEFVRDAAAGGGIAYPPLKARGKA
jgi:FkbM family methyltransferase